MEKYPNLGKHYTVKLGCGSKNDLFELHMIWP